MSSLFKSRTPVSIGVYVYSKIQKDLFFDIMSGGIEKPIYIKSTANYILYRVDFQYYTNFKAFLYDYNGIYPEYRFKFFRYKD